MTQLRTCISCLVQVLLVLAQVLLLSAQFTPAVYVYELSYHLTEAVVSATYQESWLLGEYGGYEYEADLWVHDKMTNGPWRVSNPENANAFYIPILPTRYLHQMMNASVSWQEARLLSSVYVEEALQMVKRHPYWARHNGRDHFVTMTADSARCTHLRAASKVLWGNLSVIMHLGDPSMRQDGMPCYQPGQDILLPAYNPLQIEPVASVSLHPRNITVLYRFGTTGPTASHRYHDRFIRSEIRTNYEAHAVRGSDWEIKNIKQTMDDMSRAMFCVCPPGVVAHTSRFWRSLRRGCIPVTFFQGYQLPFSDSIDYASFTVNILPDSIHTMHDVLTSLLNNRSRQQSLQHQIQQIQPLLVWDGTAGIQTLFGTELSARINSCHGQKL